MEVDPPVLYQPKKPGMHRVNWAHSKLGSDSTTDDIMVKQLASRILSTLTKPKKPLMPLTWSRPSEASNTKHVSISFSGLMRWDDLSNICVDWIEVLTTHADIFLCTSQLPKEKKC